MKEVSVPEVDVLKDLYYKLKDLPREDVEVNTTDLTEELEYYLKDKIAHGELVNISIRGEPGTGKSVIMLALKWKTNKILANKRNVKIDEYDTITSDQNEFLRKAKEERFRGTCIGIDEFNPMARTGANATTEEAEFEFFSNLCRIYYIHRISCSPMKIIDPNANVILDVMGKDIPNKRTHVKILYYHPLEGKVVALGSALIDVSEILKADHYRRYEKKKMMRVDLLNKQGIRDVRELEFNTIGIRIIDEIRPILQTIAKGELRGLINIKTINIMQEMYQRPISFVAKDEMVDKPFIILSNMKALQKITEKEGLGDPRAVRAGKLYLKEIEKSENRMREIADIHDKYQKIE